MDESENSDYIKQISAFLTRIIIDLKNFRFIFNQNSNQYNQTLSSNDVNIYMQVFSWSILGVKFFLLLVNKALVLLSGSHFRIYVSDRIKSVSLCAFHCV